MIKKNGAPKKYVNKDKKFKAHMKIKKNNGIKKYIIDTNRLKNIEKDFEKPQDIYIKKFNRHRKRSRQ